MPDSTPASLPQMPVPSYDWAEAAMMVASLILDSTDALFVSCATIMPLDFDRAAYTDLLSQVTPKVIETETEYEQTLAVVESLAFNQNRTTEQTALYKLLVLLLEAYETAHYPTPEASPTEVLHHILEASNTHPVDLVGLLGTEEMISEIADGTRAISKAQAQILADRFKVSPSLFIA